MTIADKPVSDGILLHSSSQDIQHVGPLEGARNKETNR